MAQFLMKPKIDFAFKEIMMDEKARIVFFVFTHVDSKIRAEYVFLLLTHVLNTCIIVLSHEERRRTVAKVSEIVKKIKKTECYKVREGSNHEIWYCPSTGEEFPVPRHYAKELSPGTANSILRKAGLK